MRYFRALLLLFVLVFIGIGCMSEDVRQRSSWAETGRVDTKASDSKP